MSHLVYMQLYSSDDRDSKSNLAAAIRLPPTGTMEGVTLKDFVEESTEVLMREQQDLKQSEWGLVSPVKTPAHTIAGDPLHR